MIHFSAEAHIHATFWQKSGCLSISSMRACTHTHATLDTCRFYWLEYYV